MREPAVAGALEELRKGRLSAGRAYAMGYLAQLLVNNMAKANEEYDWVRSQWDRFHREIYRRVSGLDEGWYEEEDTEETEEIEETEETEEVEAHRGRRAKADSSPDLSKSERSDSE